MSLGVRLRNATASLRYALYSIALLSPALLRGGYFLHGESSSDVRAESQTEPPIASAQPIAQPQNAVLQPGLLDPKPIEPTIEPPMPIAQD